MFRVWICLALFAAALPPNHESEVRKWRQEYEAGLKRDNSWLTLAGLFWLKQDANTFGSGPGNSIVLPAGSAPETAGAFVLHGNTVLLRVREGVHLTVNGKPVQTEMPLKPDVTGAPDRIAMGRLSMIVIQRSKRFGIRMWDNDSANRRNFPGARWYPVKESWRIEAQWTAYPQPQNIPILNILGDTEPSPSPGYASFKVNGRDCRLEPLLEGKNLFFLFKDLTSGRETYAPGRFLDAEMPAAGKVILDFNKAYNPPCAFTPYATCPLPPKQNRLPVAVDAGALSHGHPGS